MSDNYGFLVVASNRPNFYKFAINLIESIKDYYPEAKTCLVTESKYLDGREKIADHLILCDGKCDSALHRAKLWGMANTPFDTTFYLDADMQVDHEDITTAFDQLGDNDMMFSELNQQRDPIFKDAVFPAGRFELCGGVCLYKSSNPLVRQFMHDWWELYVKQYNREWWPTTETGEWDTVNYPHKEFSYWDQFSLWWLTKKEPKYQQLKIGVFEDDARWNYYTKFDLLPFKVTKKPPIVMHFSSTDSKHSVILGNLK